MRIRPHLRHYRGADVQKRRDAATFNEAAKQVADFISKDFAECGKTSKTYIFALIAAELDMSIDIVREAISDGGFNGITLKRD